MKENLGFYLTKSEAQVMQVLWRSEEPITQHEIIERATQAGELTFKDRSIFILLNNLLDKGLVEQVGMYRCGRSYGRTFRPSMSRAEWYARVVYNALDAKELKVFRHTMCELDKDNTTT